MRGKCRHLGLYENSYHDEVEAGEVRANSNLHTLYLSTHRNTSNQNVIERIYQIFLQNQKMVSLSKNGWGLSKNGWGLSDR